MRVWRPRYQAPPGVVPGQTSLVLTAVLKSYGTLGSGLVNSGVPVREGDLFPADVTARKVRVFVNGIEQAVYCAALKGRFKDGSVRSVQIQFQYNIPSTAAITAEIRIGEVRQTTDIAYSSVTTTVMLSRRYLIVTDVAYACQTWATFERLLPAAQENAENTTYFTTLSNERFYGTWPYPGAPGGVIGRDFDLTNGVPAGATYEHVASLYGFYQKTGNLDFYDNAHLRAYYLLTGYSLPDTSFNLVTPHPNENGLPGVTPWDGPPEWHSQRYVGFGVAYLFTGCVEFHNVIAERNSAFFYQRKTISTAMNDVTNAQGNFGWVDDTYSVRFNLIGTWCAALGILLDCTHTYGFSGKYGTPAQFTVGEWQTRIQWILDAFEFHKYTTGYWAGMRGNRQTSTTGGTLGAGQAPHFQWTRTIAFLIFWYENIKADPTVATWIKTMVDIVWDNSMHASVGFNNLPIQAYAYLLTATAGNPGFPEDPYTQTMWAGPISFCKAYFGDAKYNGYYTESVNVNHVKPPFLFWHWKIWGENYGHNMGAPYRSQIGIPTGRPTSIIAPTLY